MPVCCYLPSSYGRQLLLLPLYGYFTWGLHAGYAVYFPELFPHQLRPTGTGFCFNGGRLLASPILVLSGWLKALPGMDLAFAVTLMSLLFPVGLVVIAFMPETRDRPLPQ